jgi:hypothetical protein
VYLRDQDKSNTEKEVRNDCYKKYQGGALARRIIRKSLSALVLLATSGIAYAQEKDHDRKDEINFSSSIPSPATPDTITPPEGTSAFLLGHGVRTQGYVCLPSGPGAASWTANPARPEATLFTRLFGEAVQIITVGPSRRPAADRSRLEQRSQIARCRDESFGL